MKRKCPNCAERGVPILQLLLWNSRCKNCGAIVGVSHSATLLVAVLAGLAIAVGAYLAFEQFGMFAIKAALVAYILVVIMAEIAGRLIVINRHNG